MAQNQEMDRPPTYDEVESLAANIPPLDLSNNAGSAIRSTVTKDQCIVHLKLLAALADLRDTVSSEDKLFGIEDSEADRIQHDAVGARVRVREKRWAVYTSRAVHRFALWWDLCLPTSGRLPTLDDLMNPSYSSVTSSKNKVPWNRDNMPPLDILMVWHAHMLNPRAFLEDCIRNAKMSFWATGLPWDVINNCIDNNNFNYEPGDTAKKDFEEKTGLSWNNLDDPPNLSLPCPSCQVPVSVPWTAGRMGSDLSTLFDDCYGYADRGFQVTCPGCGLSINHEKLRVAKFNKDLHALIEEQRPVPGTFFNTDGVTIAVIPLQLHGQFFPNRLLTELAYDLFQLTDPKLSPSTTMATIRDFFEEKLKDHDFVKKAKNSQRWRLTRNERIAVRRMMSRYWDNSSPFALDLVGAVIRQGTFVQKMDDIDWLHSPALVATMDRLIEKYRVFFTIMVDNPNHMAVPTLDVDLAWHTHQLDPSRYYTYSVVKTMPLKTFIDHDDKVAEDKLSDAFAWTSKVYKKITNGGLYSECTCWYCEAIRAPDLSGLFVSSATARAREAAQNLHNRSDISPDPSKNAHISAHNAVRPPQAGGLDRARLKIDQLRTVYEKHRRRAEKRNSKSKQGLNSEKNARDPRAYQDVPMVWGLAYAPGFYGPFYGPYMCDPGINADAYAHNPACMNTNPGAVGNCVGGTCGGAVAAGGCGGMGGACAGGAAGGCGGTGFGGCGGGMGGGCGGGGGGCGGGGGGGCGGGGGGC
ncbi:conserved hypothetical protein [Paecilomyces variotii No. 5]|uniref:Alpha-ketoglutarate-dependent sulfonate dioxygenase n=1 Tax=Byssochlamys spectabilis (strain No. 5 / NBRC 109023) TaxID=1356009 RepID=V5FXQ9_BYSSN|nr:conserved hypothetical protein [Paecilomyces variotii No. 5]